MYLFVPKRLCLHFEQFTQTRLVPPLPSETRPAAIDGMAFFRSVELRTGDALDLLYLLPIITLSFPFQQTPTHPKRAACGLPLV